MVQPRQEQPATLAIRDAFPFLVLLGCTVVSAQVPSLSTIVSISATQTQPIRLLAMCIFGLMRSHQPDAILHVLLIITFSLAQPVVHNAVSAILGALIARITSNTPALHVMQPRIDSTLQPATTMALKATASTIPALMAITACKYKWYAHLVRLAAKPAQFT